MSVMKWAVKKVHKKVKASGSANPGNNEKPIMKKPSSALTPNKLQKLDQMTLEEKLAHYNKKGHEVGIDSFLAHLGDKERQRLWKQFEQQEE